MCTHICTCTCTHTYTPHICWCVYTCTCTTHMIFKWRKSKKQTKIIVQSLSIFLCWMILVPFIFLQISLQANCSFSVILSVFILGLSVVFLSKCLYLLKGLLSRKQNYWEPCAEPQSLINQKSRWLCSIKTAMAKSTHEHQHNSFYLTLSSVLWTQSPLSYVQVLTG